MALVLNREVLRFSFERIIGYAHIFGFNYSRYGHVSGKRAMDSDLEYLQGLWRQVAFEENGSTDPLDTHGAPGAVMTVARHTFRVSVPGEETLVEGSFTIDASRHPKCIDWIDSIGDDAGKVIPAIYELGSDSFRFAAADPDTLRPESFAGGQGITIRTFVRV